MSRDICRSETVVESADGADRPGSASPREGQRFGVFRVFRRLGEGGMGTVHLADNLSMGRRIALKVVREDLADNPIVLQRFAEEIRLLGRVRSDHVVRCLGSGWFGRVPYCELELVEGRSLFSYARDERMTVPRIVRIVWRLAQALAATHEAGIVHRDVKPTNILLERRGGVERPVLIDFGLAVRIGEGRPAGEERGVFGTPQYMAPERWEMEADDPDPRLDIYSLGATFYELLTGASHIDTRSTTAYFSGLRDGKIVPPRQGRVEIPETVERICLRMIEPDPDRRYPSAGAVVADLRDALFEIVRQRTTLVVRRRIERRSLSHRLAWGAIGAAAGALVGFVAPAGDDRADAGSLASPASIVDAGPGR